VQARAYGANANRQMDWNLEPFVPVVRRSRCSSSSPRPKTACATRLPGLKSRASTSSFGRHPRRPSANAALLKAKNVPVILSNVLTMPAGEDTFHAANYQAAGELAKAGVTFAFSSGGYE
jgi:hypothetical protein